MIDRYFFTEWGNAQTHANNITMIQIARGDNNIGPLMRAFPGLIQNTDQWIGLPGDDVLPTSMAVWDDTHVLVIISGLESASHFQNLLLNWQWPIVKTPTDGEGKPFARAVDRLLSRLPGSLSFRGKKVLIVGHSYGGATSECLAVRLQNTATPSEMRCYTYGAPRAGDSRLQSACDNLFMIRVQSDYDPVPSIPPHVGQAPFLSVIAPPTLTAGVNTQIQPCTGYKVAASGQITAFASDFTLFDAVELRILDWLTGTNAFGNNYHGLEYYAACFQAGIVLGLQLDARINRRLDPQPRVRLTMSTREATTLGIAQLAASAATVSQVKQQLPLTVMNRNPALVYRARKIKRLWVVKYGTDIVQVCKGKRNAKSVARQLNRTKRALFRVARV